MTQTTPLAEAFEILSHSVEPPLRIVILWRDVCENANLEPSTPVEMDGLTIHDPLKPGDTGKWPRVGRGIAVAKGQRGGDDRPPHRSQTERPAGSQSPNCRDSPSDGRFRDSCSAPQPGPMDRQKIRPGNRPGRSPRRSYCEPSALHGGGPWRNRLKRRFRDWLNSRCVKDSSPRASPAQTRIVPINRQCVGP